MRRNTHTYMSWVTPSTDTQGHTSSGHTKVLQHTGRMDKGLQVCPEGHTPMCTHTHTHTHIHTRVCVQGPIGALGRPYSFKSRQESPSWLSVRWWCFRPYGQRRTWAPSSGEPSTALRRGRGAQNGPRAHRFTEAWGEPAACQSAASPPIVEAVAE